MESRYSVVEEAFLPSNAAVTESTESPGTYVCVETQNVVEWSEEENYLFRLVEFKEELKKWLKENNVSWGAVVICRRRFFDSH